MYIWLQSHLQALLKHLKNAIASSYLYSLRFKNQLLFYLLNICFNPENPLVMHLNILETITLDV